MITAVFTALCSGLQPRAVRLPNRTVKTTRQDTWRYCKKFTRVLALIPQKIISTASLEDAICESIWGCTSINLKLSRISTNEDSSPVPDSNVDNDLFCPVDLQSEMPSWHHGVRPSNSLLWSPCCLLVRSLWCHRGIKLLLMGISQVPASVRHLRPPFTIFHFTPNADGFQRWYFLSKH